MSKAMKKGLEYNDEYLRDLFFELEPKERVKALKGGFRKVANRVKKTAINNLRACAFQSDKDMEKGVRSMVFKKKAGFRVTIGTKKTKNINK